MTNVSRHSALVKLTSVIKVHGFPRNLSGFIRGIGGPLVGSAASARQPTLVFQRKRVYRAFIQTHAEIHLAAKSRVPISVTGAL